MLLIVGPVRKIIGRVRSLAVPPVCSVLASAQYVGTLRSFMAAEAGPLGAIYFFITSGE